MRRRLVHKVGAALGTAVVLGVALRAARPPVAAMPVTKPTIAERAEPPPSPPTRVGQANLPPEEVIAALARGPQEPLTPPVIQMEVGDSRERGVVPTAEPLVPPVIDLGEIELGRGARPTAEPLVPPVIVIPQDT